MISSMTGFGRYEYTEGNRKVIVEIKSVNHRYLDMSLKLSRRISALEQRIRAKVKEKVGRGKLDIYVHYEEPADDNFDIRYNAHIAEAYINNMRKMQQEFGITDDISVTKVAAMPDVFELVPVIKDEEDMMATVSVALDKALSLFIESRRIEGDKLKTDLLSKLEEMSGYVDEIEALSPQIITAYRTRLTEKVQELLDNQAVDESRIATEVTIYADKICVDEEIVRLKSHIKEVTRTLSEEDAVGRKLDFLAQELNREANTILSKSTNAELADIGISLKTLIEKIREQIQNVE